MKEEIMVTNEQKLYDHNDMLILKTYHSNVQASKRYYREHYHTACELSLFFKGHGTYTVGAKEYEFSPGDVFLFGSNEHHCITAIYEETEILNVHFEPQILWGNASTMELMALFLSRNDRFENIFRNDEFLKQQILALEDEVRSEMVGHVIQAKHHLFSALIHMIRSYGYTTNDMEFSTKHHSTTKTIKKVLAYIDNNLDKKLTLGELANIASVSENYFSCLFKKLNGISPWDYIVLKRVEKAIELLETTDKNKIDIAEMCGFTSSSNFYKAFARVTGKTPSEYVKSISTK